MSKPKSPGFNKKTLQTREDRKVRIRPKASGTHKRLSKLTKKDKLEFEMLKRDILKQGRNLLTGALVDDASYRAWRLYVQTYPWAAVIVCTGRRIP